MNVIRAIVGFIAACLPSNNAYGYCPPAKR